MELKRIKELVVYRDLWVRGSKKGTSLLNEHGMCCLGFACLTTGVPPADLHLCGEPMDIEFDAMGVEVPALVHFDEGERQHTPLTGYAIEINDNSDIDDHERERLLAEVFGRADEPIALRFEDTAPVSLRDAYMSGLPVPGNPEDSGDDR